jgi:phosphatidylethanolamine/phosphatidyl-N-methylethanolamine N-methyltransferase
LNNKTIEKIYRNYSGIYDIVWGKIFESSREEAIQHLDIRPGHRILEVGVGSGLTLPFYPPHCQVVGIDISDRMLAKASKRIERHGYGNVTLKQMDASHMAFYDDTFDAVFAAYVITVVPDPKSMIAEIKRVCKKNGKIVFLNHFESDNKVISMIEKAISPFCTKRMAFRTDFPLSKLLEEDGLNMVRKRQMPPLNLWRVVEMVNVKPGDQ